MADDKPTIHDEYLGDGVYASFDGFQIWLDTRAQSPVNRIALDPQTYSALLRYAQRIKALITPPGEPE
jgi:hypothetical protein